MALRTMFTSKLPVIVIVGATGTGKTRLSVELALKYGTEIISGDSMQIYKALDVVTAKASQRDRSLVPHHLLDMLEPHQRFTVVDFRNRALKIIDNLIDRGKIPIIAGGTVYYMESIIFNNLIEDTEDSEHLLYEKDEDSRKRRQLERSLKNNEKAKQLNLEHKEDVKIKVERLLSDDYVIPTTSIDETQDYIKEELFNEPEKYGLSPDSGQLLCVKDENNRKRKELYLEDDVETKKPNLEHKEKEDVKIKLERIISDDYVIPITSIDKNQDFIKEEPSPDDSGQLLCVKDENSRKRKEVDNSLEDDAESKKPNLENKEKETIKIKAERIISDDYVIPITSIDKTQDLIKEEFSNEPEKSPSSDDSGQLFFVKDENRRKRKEVKHSLEDDVEAKKPNLENKEEEEHKIKPERLISDDYAILTTSINETQEIKEERLNEPEKSEPSPDDSGQLLCEKDENSRKRKEVRKEKGVKKKAQRLISEEYGIPTTSTDDNADYKKEKLLDDLENEEMFTNDEIYEKLQAVDPVMANRLHPNNRRKLLR